MGRFFGFYGVHYTGGELKKAFQQAMARREAQAGQSYECFPDIPFHQVMADLFRAKGITENAETGQWWVCLVVLVLMLLLHVLTRYLVSRGTIKAIDEDA